MKLVCLFLTLCFFCGNSSGADGAEKPDRSIFHSDESHLWNRLHSLFFVREDKKGNEFGGDLVDPYLWPSTTNFLLNGATHSKAIALLDEFIICLSQQLISDQLMRGNSGIFLGNDQLIRGRNRIFLKKDKWLTCL